MSTIQEEVLGLTKVKPKAGESAEDFTRRVVKKVNALADADAQNWEALSDEAQAWVNKNTQADDAETELDCLELPEAEGEPAEGAAPDAEEGEEEPAEEATEEPTVKQRKPASRKAAKPAKAAKPVKEKVAKKAKPAKASNGAGRGRKPLFPDSGKIKMLVKENPHREGTIRDKAFKKVKAGMTVAEAVKAGCPRQQVWSMFNRKLISISA